MTIGDRIKAIREAKGISQEELSKLVGLKDKSSVCKIEKAGNNISRQSIEKYAEALGVSVGKIMGWDEIPPSIEETNLLDVYGDLWRKGYDLPTTPKQIREFFNFYISYSNAPQNIRVAVQALLGSDEQDP